MSRRTTLSIVLFLLLSAIASSAPAASSGFASDLFERAWGLLDWLRAPTAKSTPADRADGRGPLRGIWAENGVCIDPDGRPAGAACSAVVWSDGGVCIDPNGKPGAAGCAY